MVREYYDLTTHTYFIRQLVSRRDNEKLIFHVYWENLIYFSVCMLLHSKFLENEYFFDNEHIC